jgi:hypothetical protein
MLKTLVAIGRPSFIRRALLLHALTLGAPPDRRRGGRDNASRGGGKVEVVRLHLHGKWHFFIPKMVGVL